MSWRWPGSRRSMWPRRRPWCTRMPREGGPGRFVTGVWPAGAATNEIIEPAAYRAGRQAEKVVLESASAWWRPFLYLMEAAGLHVELVNARDVKNAPGRPVTDRLDAVWLASLAGWGMLRPSFVPPAEIRQLRDYTRLRTDLTRGRTRHWQRLEKLLEDALVKVTTVASRIDTMPVRDIVEALIAGQRDPRRLAELARGRMKAKRAALIEALTGRIRRPPRRTGRHLAGPDRRPYRADRRPQHQDRGTDRRDSRRPGRQRRRDHRPARRPRPGRGSTASHRPAAGDPRHLPARRPGHHRRDRPGHDAVPHRRAPDLPGAAVPPHHPVRRQ